MDRDGFSGLFPFIRWSLSVLVNLSLSCSTIFLYSPGFMAAQWSRLAFRRVLLVIIIILVLLSFETSHLTCIFRHSSLKWLWSFIVLFRNIFLHLKKAILASRSSLSFIRLLRVVFSSQQLEVIGWNSGYSRSTCEKLV